MLLANQDISPVTRGHISWDLCQCLPKKGKEEALLEGIYIAYHGHDIVIVYKTKTTDPSYSFQEYFLLSLSFVSLFFFFFHFHFPSISITQ